MVGTFDHGATVMQQDHHLLSIYADQERITVGWLVVGASKESRRRSITTFALL